MATSAVVHRTSPRLPVLLVLINVAGGIAVLGSYIHGMTTHPDTAGLVWGGVPESLKPLYTVSMLLAAVGYFPFTFYAVFRLDPQRLRVGRFGYELFLWLYALVLVPSAVWMPLTFEMLEEPSLMLWIAIRVTLFAVGLGSLGILVAIAVARPRVTGLAYGLALAGCIAFCLQTAVLDALVWPAYFPDWVGAG